MELISDNGTPRGGLGSQLRPGNCHGRERDTRGPNGEEGSGRQGYKEEGQPRGGLDLAVSYSRLRRCRVRAASG